MIEVTSINGRKITLENSGSDVIASSGPVKFSVVRTANGFESRFLVAEAGNRRIEVALAGADLTKAHALFDECRAEAERRASEIAEYESRKARVLKGMQGK